jgi:hypothetical protein
MEGHLSRAPLAANSSLYHLQKFKLTHYPRFYRSALANKDVAAPIVCPTSRAEFDPRRPFS